MTANCSVTHFYAGGIKISTGKAYLRDEDGNYITVVCTAPKDASEIHYRDLAEGATIHVPGDEVSIELAYRSEFDQGAAGRQQFGAAYKEFCANTVIGQAKRAYVYAALAELPHNADESRAYCVEVSAEFLAGDGRLPKNLVSALVETNLGGYVETGDVLDLMSRRPEYYVEAIASLAKRANDLPDDAELVLGEVNQAVLERSARLAELALALARDGSGGLAASGAGLLAEAVYKLELAGMDADRVLRDGLEQVAPGAIEAAEATRKAELGVVDETQTIVAEERPEEVDAVAEPVATEPAAPEPEVAAVEKVAGDSEGAIAGAMRRSDERIMQVQAEASAAGNGINAAGNATYAKLDDLYYRVPSDEIRAGLRRVMADQEEQSGSARVLSEQISAARVRELTNVAALENEVVAKVMDRLGSFSPETSAEEREGLLEELRRNLQELDRADESSYNAWRDGASNLRARAEEFRSHALRSLAPILGDTDHYYELSSYLDDQVSKCGRLADGSQNQLLEAIDHRKEIYGALRQALIKATN